MPKKHDNAPKWSNEELRIASDFQQFLAMHENTQEEKEDKKWYPKKCDRLTASFASLYKKKYNVLQEGEYLVYKDLPQGVRSAASHLASLARQKREMAKRVRRAQEELIEDWERRRGDIGFLIAHADPEELDNLLAHLPQGDE